MSNSEKGVIDMIFKCPKFGIVLRSLKEIKYSSTALDMVNPVTKWSNAAMHISV